MKKSTTLRFLRAKSPDELTRLVGALPFKIEIKEIIKDGRAREIYFTLPDGMEKITNEILRVLCGR